MLSGSYVDAAAQLLAAGPGRALWPVGAEGTERFLGQRMVICLLPRVSEDSSDIDVSGNWKVLDLQKRMAGSQAVE